MKEVERDNKWNDEADGCMKSAQDGIGSSMDALEAHQLLAASLMSAGPSETDLVQVALLMRLYDVGMAILSHINKPQADEIYEAHGQGRQFNPPVYIPTMEDTEDESPEN